MSNKTTMSDRDFFGCMSDLGTAYRNGEKIWIGEHFDSTVQFTEKNIITDFSIIENRILIFPQPTEFQCKVIELYIQQHNT